jgi:cytochrome c-type biogenesis protein CcmH
MSPEERQAMIRSMVDRLAARLEQNPNDKDGWTRLAHAYDVLGESEKAEAARARAAGLGTPAGVPASGAASPPTGK